MTSDQEQHLYDIKTRFCAGVDQKYRAGQLEHGGDLWRKPGLFPMLKDEVRDFVVYAHTLEQQLRDVLALMEAGLFRKAQAQLADILDGQPD